MKKECHGVYFLSVYSLRVQCIVCKMIINTRMTYDLKGKLQIIEQGQ